MSVGSSASPDFEGAAQKTADSGRANVNSPFGSFNWSKGADGRDTMNIGLDPRQMQALQSQFGLQAGRMGMAEGMMGRVGQDMSKGISYDAAKGAGQQGADAMYGKLTSRLDPQWQQRNDKFKSDALNQGLSYGDEGYQQQAGNLGRQENDAYLGANQQATMMGQQYEGQDLQNQMAGMSGNLNLMNLLAMGQGVQNPQQYNTGQGANFLGAAQAQGNWNQQQQGLNQELWGDAMGAAGYAGGMAAGGYFGRT
jgi:hypothetical protein